MKAPVPSSPVSHSPVVGDTDLCAVLVLDSTGKVVATNESARLLWAAPDLSFVGTPLGGMLLTENTASEAISTDVPWQTVRTVALNAWAPFAAKPQSGALRAVRIRLERAVGGAGSYIAIIRPR